MPKDMTGMEDIIVLNNQDSNHAVFLPLKSLSKDIVSYYQTFCSNVNQNFEQEFGVEEGSFVSTLQLCCSMFHTCRPKPGVETIVYFTNFDSPHRQNSNEYHKAILKANDLREIHVDFEVIPMGEDFNYNVFYKEFMCLVKGLDIDKFEIGDTDTRKEELKKHKLALNLKNRCICRFNWILEEGFELAVGYYHLFCKGSMPKSVTLLRSDNSVIQKRRVKELVPIAEDGSTSSEAQLLLPGEETYVFKSRGETIPLSNADIEKLKTPIPPSLKLVSFMENEIPLDFYIKPSGFIYPDEQTIIGSTKLFQAIWQKCIEMKKIALCVLVQKKKSYPSYVVLEPTQSGFVGNIKTYDGFCVHYLPSFDCIRNVDISAWETEKPSNEQIAFMKKVVKKLRVTYDPHSKTLLDPALEELSAKVISLAFDVETDDLDSLKPNIKEQDQRMNISTEEFFNLFGEEDVEIASKRPGTSKTDSTTAKKIKPNVNINEESIIEMVASNSLGNLTVSQLKDYLQQKGETGLSKLTKPGLISKITDMHS